MKHDDLDRIMAYSEAMLKVILESDTPSRLSEEKLDGIKQVLSRTNYYIESGIRKDIVDAITEKKLSFILDAKTIADVKLAAKQPEPHFDGSKWYVKPFTVPEEELVLWSMTSLKAPLPDYAFKRYCDLFEQVLGISQDDLMKE